MNFSIDRLKEKYPDLEKVFPTFWLEKIDTLGGRERNIVLGGLFCAIAFGLYLGVSTGMTKLSTAEKQLKNYQATLSQIQKLSVEIKQKEEEGQRLQTRIVPASSGFILASHMEKEALRYRVSLAKTLNETRTDIGDNLEEVSTDVRIDSIGFTKLINMLMELENHPASLIRIKRLRMKALSDPIMVETNFKVVTYLRKQ